MDMKKYFTTYIEIVRFLNRNCIGEFVLDNVWTANYPDKTLHIEGHSGDTQIEYDSFTDRLSVYINYDHFMLNGGADGQKTDS